MALRVLIWSERSSTPRLVAATGELGTIRSSNPSERCRSSARWSPRTRADSGLGRSAPKTTAVLGVLVLLAWGLAEPAAGSTACAPEASLGAETVVEIALEIDDAMGIAGFELCAPHDCSLLRCTEVAPGTLTADWELVSRFDEGGCELCLIGYRTDGSVLGPGNGSLATFLCEAVGDPGVRVEVCLEDWLVGDSRGRPLPIEACECPLSGDGDEDGVPNGEDNCKDVANGPLAPDAGGNAQRDSDADGYGNVCDADFNQDQRVDFLDLGYLKSVFFTADPEADLNGDGRVDFLDLGRTKALFFRPPGPSGLACAGTVPCP